MSVAYAVPASWRPASMISKPALAARLGGETFLQLVPPSAVTWTTPLFVAAQITPAFRGESENVVMDGICGACAGPWRAGTSVRSGLISCQVCPESDVFIMNCVP